MPQLVDLRSDTVTRPTAAMRKAMVEADVGDDVLGDDPSVIRLQEVIAELLGKEAAVFVPSATMANQIAIRAQTEPGDELIAHADSHIIHYETGAPAALSGVMIHPLSGPRGMFDAADVRAGVRSTSPNFARSRMLVVENTQNRGGGSVWPLEQIRRVTDAAREYALCTHLDGARIWNASAKTGISVAEYARPFDTVSCCFSKGLGAPVGSALCGSKATVLRAHRFRKMFGGSMRQAGILAAAALYGLKHHRDRLVEDHANAQRLALGLGDMRGIEVSLSEVETNMVFFDLAPAVPLDAAELCTRLKADNVLMMPTGPRKVRAVCHLDVDTAGIDRALMAISRIVTGRIST